MIAGVKIKTLGVYEDDRGAVLQMLRSDDAGFIGFGEIYFSITNPGAVKAWKRQNKATLNYAVLNGELRLVLFDDRVSSPSFGKVWEMVLNRNNYSLVTIPPGIWVGFSALGDCPAILANCADRPHDAADLVRLDESSPVIPFKWT